MTAPVGHHRRASGTSRAFLLWGPTDFSFSEWSGGEGTRISLDPAHMELWRKRESEERPTRVKSGETERCEDRFRASKIMEIEGAILSWWLYGTESGRRFRNSLGIIGASGGVKDSVTSPTGPADGPADPVVD